MKLTLFRKTERAKECLIYLEHSVWGCLPCQRLQALFSFSSEVTDLSAAEAESLKTELLNTARRKLWHWLARQEHCCHEAELYLKRWRFHPSLIFTCLQEAQDKGFLDDARYCRLLIESLLERQKSPVQIKAKLYEKHLPSGLWEPILAELVQDHPIHDILQAQAEKVYARYAHLDRRTAREKCLTALYRKGFDLEEAEAVIRALLDSK